MAVSGLHDRKVLSALGGPFPSFLGLESSRLALWGLHFRHTWPVFQLRQVAISQET